MQFFKFTRVGRMIPVTVLKRAGGRWKVVEAGMSSAGIVIRRARVLGNSGAPLSPSDRGPLDRAIRASEAAPADAIPSLNNHGQVILLAGSDRSICRLMQLPQASEEDTRRMVALRLETELPYPVAESLWACERAVAPEAEGASPARNGATSVILLATPMAEIAESEKSLGLTGRSPCAVQLEAGALAELGQAAARPAETVALCRVEDRASDVVILHHGRLRYARRLFSGGPQCGEPDAEERRKLCDELDQCLHHYALAPDAAAPTRLILTGEGARVPGLAFELGRRVGLPAEVMALPAAVRVEGKEGGAEDLLAEFPACVGALLAALRTLRGERPAAPPLRRSREPLLRRLGWQASLSRRRGALAGMSFVMVVALVAISFAVRKARSEEATGRSDRVSLSSGTWASCRTKWMRSNTRNPSSGRPWTCCSSSPKSCPRARSCSRSTSARGERFPSRPPSPWSRMPRTRPSGRCRKARCLRIPSSWARPSRKANSSAPSRAS